MGIETISEYQCGNEKKRGNDSTNYPDTFQQMRSGNKNSDNGQKYIGNEKGDSLRVKIPNQFVRGFLRCSICDKFETDLKKHAKHGKLGEN